MQLAALATVEYGSGRVVLFPGRFNPVGTGGSAMPPDFARHIVQWAASAGDDDLVSVCQTSISGPDATIPELDDARAVSVARVDIDFLSEAAALDAYEVVVLCAYSNVLSPLVQQNLLDFVLAGGGLVVLDADVDGANIELLDLVAPVLVDHADFSETSGSVVWTTAGKASPIYSEAFVAYQWRVANTIPVSGLSPQWSVLASFDTEQLTVPSDDLVSEDSFQASDDFLVSGGYMVGFYSTVYEDGVVGLERED